MGSCKYMKSLRIFLDSGAHSIYQLLLKNKEKEGYKHSKELWKYIDNYAEFVKKNEHLLELYVNVDIIFDPEMTWEVQKYLEQNHGLKPLPVFHPGEDFKWLKLYLDNYDYIGLGGVGQITKSYWMHTVGDPAFDLICDTKNRLPRCKVHGFAMTSPELMTKYPFFSVDSTSWVQYGKYGMIVVPRSKNGKYDYTKSPWALAVSTQSKKITKEGTMHLDNLTNQYKKYVQDYLNEKGFILGKSEFKNVHNLYKLKLNEHWADKSKGLVEIIIEKGLCNSHELRDKLNLLYFFDLEKSIPEWPWPWERKIRYESKN